MILAMVGLSELTREAEILFPEMAALTIGMWIVNKRVWRVSGPGLVLLMTAGAAAGVCIVRYSPLPLLGNIAAAFAFAALCLLALRSTLIPLISACLLPVLLHTCSWVYPAAVAVMSVIVVCGRVLLVRCGVRQEVRSEPDPEGRGRAALRWTGLGVAVLAVAFVAVRTMQIYFILPPLIVTCVEFSSSGANFRKRPLQVFGFLAVAAALGAGFMLAGHVWLGIPKRVVALAVFLCLFALFERTGKFFAPAGAVALIPMLIPESDLPWFPLQAAGGAAVFIALSMIFFQRCFAWPCSRSGYRLISDTLRSLRPRAAERRREI